MQASITLEVCIESLQSALIASDGGADRVELNSAIALGGLTPTTGLLAAVKNRINLPVICMVRPRPGDFFYTDDEFELMIAESRQLIDAGADGLAVGFLEANGHIDASRTARLREICGNKELVFHRAFDCTPDLAASTKKLVELGVDRVLTSGGKPTAVEGAKQIEELQKEFGSKIEILPGSGISSPNVQSLIRSTGCTQVHGTFRSVVSSGSTFPGPLNFNEVLGLAANEKYESSLEEIRAVVAALRETAG